MEVTSESIGERVVNHIAAVVAGLSLAFVGTSTSIAATITAPVDQPTIAAGTYHEHMLNPGGVPKTHHRHATVQSGLDRACPGRGMGPDRPMARRWRR